MESTCTNMLRIAEVCRRTGLSRSQIHRMIDGSSFPEPIKLSARATAWVEAEVEGWLQDRIAAAREAR